MTRPLAIALVGDHDPRVTAHRAIPLALQRAAVRLERAVTPTWYHTAELGSDPASRLEACDGVWVVPASPYADTDAALAAIRFARETGRPFLGTCGGFQHAVLEYCRNVLGQADAGHAELDPDAGTPVIAPLACSLVEAKGTIRFIAGSRLARAYSAIEVTEEYHCRYGLAPGVVERLAATGFCPTGHDPAGEVRALELDGHPFFVITLFQPERAALRDQPAPPVEALLRAAVVRRAEPSGIP